MRLYDAVEVGSDVLGPGDILSATTRVISADRSAGRRNRLGFLPVDEVAAVGEAFDSGVRREKSSEAVAVQNRRQPTGGAAGEEGLFGYPR